MIQAAPSQWPFVDEAISNACGGSTEYAHPTGTAAAAGRRYLRRAQLLGAGPSTEEMRQFGQRLVDARMTAIRLRALSPSFGRTRPGEAVGHQVPPQAVLRRLPPRSREPLKSGDILVTHPLSGFFQELYDMAIVLILRVDGDSDTAQGLVLNKPEDSNLGTLLETVPVRSGEGGLMGPDWPGAGLLHNGALPQSSLRPLLSDTIFQGGPIVHESLEDSLLWLHWQGGAVSNALEIAPSIFIGGALSNVASLEADRRERGQAPGTRFFRGFSAWSLQQLEVELERGVWMRAQAESPDPAQELYVGEMTGQAAWRAVLEAAGLASLARFPRGSGVDAALMKLVEAHSRARALELMKAGRA